jgi:hypothetical protein
MYGCRVGDDVSRPPVAGLTQTPAQALILE